MRTGMIAAAAAAALAIGACGDSDDGSGKTTSVAVKPSAPTPGETTTTSTSAPESPDKPVTKADVIAQGDAACRAAKRKRNRLQRIGTAAEQIAALASQTSDRRIVKYVNVLQNEIGLLRRLSYARKRKQASQEKFLLDALAKQRRRARILASEYGFKSCGSG